MSETIESLLARGADVPAAGRRSRRRRSSPAPTLYDEADADCEGFWARQARRARLVRGVAHDPRVGPPVREVVRRREAQRLVQLPRPPRRQPVTATRSRSTGRASPATPARSPTRELLDGRQPRSPTRCRRSASRRATASRSTSGMVPELPMAMLACARIGAAHSVVFGGFSVGLAARPHQRRRGQGRSSPPTARGGAAQVVPLKEIADAAVAETPVDRAGARAAPHRAGRRRDDRTAATSGGTTSCRRSRRECPPESMDAEDLLYLLYTSGTTAKPKGIMHTTGGYLTQVAFTHKYVFDLHPDTDVYWCTADVGWVTGHSYIVYGPLANRATSVHVRGHARLPRQGPALVDRREVQGHDPLHRADRDPDVHEVGRRSTRARTTCRRCGCSAPSASRSTPRRGSGTGSTSAAGAARSSTRGGRPRPAPS